MTKIKRYTVIVKENGDTFKSFNKNSIVKWMSDYTESVTSQDEPWEPHFEVTTETIN